MVLTLARRLIERGHTVDLVLFKTVIHYCMDEIPDKARLFFMHDMPDQITKNNPAYTHLRAHMIPVGTYATSYWWRYVAKTIKWFPWARPSRVEFHRASQIASYINKQRPDIIFPSLPRDKIAALLAQHLSPSSPPPIVPIMCSVMENRRRKYRTRYRFLFPDAAHIVAVSDGVRDSVRKETGISAEQITTMYNPVIPDKLDDLKSQNPDHPWFSDDGPPIVLACGRLRTVKDFPVLIRAFARVSEQRCCRLIILGNGPQREALEALVHELNLEQKVSLPGWTDNPYMFMSRASLFVLCSQLEGFASVLLEALACAAPCVSTDCPAGPSEILQNGKIGLLVQVGDHAALADAMLHTLDAPPKKQKLLDRAAFFSTDKLVGKYEELIQNILKP